MNALASAWTWLAAATVSVALQSVPEAQTFDRIEIVGRYYVSGMPEFNSKHKKVSVTYNVYQSGPKEARLAEPATLGDSVAYTPTATAVIDSTHFVVGGCATGTDTLVEMWTLTEPTVTQTTDPQSGSRSYSLAAPSVVSKASIYRGDVAGKRGVQRMIKLRGKSASLLVQFADSHDLFELDYSSANGTLTLLYCSANGHGAAPVIPDLTHSDLADTRGRRHSTAGYIYLLAPRVLPEPESQGQSPSIALIDSNYDGTIDTWTQVTSTMLQGWYATGYSEIDLATRW